jgi:hypothetical protein
MSLRTRNYREAEHQAALLDRVSSGAVTRARQTVAESKSDLNTILRAYLREELEADQGRREARPAGRTVIGLDPNRYQHPFEIDLEVEELQLADAREELANRDVRAVEAQVEELMARHGLPPEDRRRLALGVLEIQVRFWEEAIQRTKGLTSIWFEPDPSPLTRSTAAPPEPPALPLKPIASDLLEPCFTHRQQVNKMRHHMVGQERATLRRFIEVAGDKAIDTYGRGDVTNFLATMRRMPAVYGRSPADKFKTIAQLIAEADEKGAKRVTERTLKRHTSALSAFFSYAKDQGHITASQRQELVTEHRFTLRKAAREQRDAWTVDELKALFASPVWTGCHPVQRTRTGPSVIRDAKFWLPLLALFHGARLEEFADLYRRHIGQDGEVWFLRISAETRSLKNENAARRIPLHPELIHLGFLRYIQEIAPIPNDPLFPELEIRGKDNRRGTAMTRWFTNYRRQIGVYRENVGMHAIRHTAIPRPRNAITTHQQDRNVDFLMGHASGGGEGRSRYDKGPELKARAATLALLSFPEVDLAHLYVEDV